MHDTQFLRRAIADALRPPPRMELSSWAEKNRVLPNEVSANPGRWKNDLFPFLTEIMDCLCPWHPAEKVVFMKSAQVGGTEIGLNWMLAVADMWASAMMMVHPTIQAAQAWVREKLTLTLRATESVRRKVIEQKSRDGASTTLFKQFPGGYWVITGANSAADISSKSIKFTVKEEWDRWPLDVDGQGDPDRLVDARSISYHASGQAKSFAPSTPTRVGHSRIYPAYLAGDQREFHVPCPQCDHEQVLYFFPKRIAGREVGGLRFETEPPYQPRYCCEECGFPIEEHHKRAMLSAGRWIAKNPGEGRQPSFHINALYSPVTTWTKMVEQFLESKDDPQKLVTFYNLWLGLPWEDRGEAPEWQRLYSLREDYPLRVIPRGGLVITCGVDVQANGFFYETVAWGKNQQSWSIDIGFIEGDTADLHSAAWRELDQLMGRLYADSYGNFLGIDSLAIDAGYNSHQVYHWVRRNSRAMGGAFAVKGMPGWMTPAFGTSSKQDIDIAGKKMGSVLLWPVGTWSLKSDLYARLRKQGAKEGNTEGNPPGYCHFSSGHDDRFFQQLTAESIKQREAKGRIVREWVANGPNHYHDCRIYNMAMADRLGVNIMTEQEWVRLASVRGVPKPNQQHELFSPRPVDTAPMANPAGEAPKPVPGKQERTLWNNERSLWKKR